MEITTLLEYSERSQLRAWLQENHSKEKECWVVMSRSKTPPPGILPYIDAKRNLSSDNRPHRDV